MKRNYLILCMLLISSIVLAQVQVLSPVGKDLQITKDARGAKSVDLVDFSTSLNKAQAQKLPAVGGNVLISEDFTAGLPSNWDAYDFDGAPWNGAMIGGSGLYYSVWTPLTSGGNQFMVSFSELYSLNEAGTGYVPDPTVPADDWMVTNPVTLNVADGDYELSWMACSFYISPYQDNLQVWVIEDAVYSAIATKTSDALVAAATKVFDETIGNWTAFKFNLNAYQGKDIRVIFRNNSLDKGAVFVDDVLLKYIPPVPNLKVTPLSDLTMAPMDQIFYGATVENAGYALPANEATLKVSVEGFSALDRSYAIPAIANGASVNIMDSNAQFMSAGTKTIVYEAICADDADQSDNKATVTVVAGDTWARDNGTLGNGVGATGSTLAYGNVYKLYNETVVNSFSVAFKQPYVPTSPEAYKMFSLNIYSYNTSTLATTHVYTSPQFTIQPENGEFVDLDIDPQTLPAGDYFFSITQSLTTTNLNVGIDTNTAGFYYRRATNGLISKQTGGSLMLRVNRESLSYNEDLGTSFEGKQLPTGWTLGGTYLWKWGYISRTVVNGQPFPDDSFLWFDGYNASANTVGSIISCEYRITETNHVLQFDLANSVNSASAANYPGLKVYFDISVNGGVSWIEGTTNEMTAISGYPANSGITKVVKDLSQYVGQVIKFRVRCISDYGYTFASVDNFEFVTPPVPFVDVDLNDNTLAEGWENGGYDDAFWEFGNDYPTRIDRTAATPFDSEFLWFNAIYWDKKDYASLTSPVFTASSVDSYLVFDIAEVLVYPEEQKDGAKLYIDVTTDGGENWILGTIDHMESLANRGTVEVVKTSVFESLSAYAGQDIRIRIRAVSDHGSSLVAIDNVSVASSPRAVPTPVSNLAVVQDEYDVVLTWDPAQISYGEGSVLFSEGFNEGIPSTWTLVDADGDGHNWYQMSEGGTPAEGTGYATSASFVNNAEGTGGDALTPDNWLITPAIVLTEGNALTYKVSAQDASWASEHYGVYISTTNTNPSSFTQLFEETMVAAPQKSGFNSEKFLNATSQLQVSNSLTPQRTVNNASRSGLPKKAQGAWYSRTVDLSAYEGQTVYIAFRHFDTTDFYQLNLDDVTIGQKPIDPELPLGYNIYRDGELIASLVTSTDFTDYMVAETPNAHVYCVTAVYRANGESAPVCQEIVLDYIPVFDGINEDFADGALPANWKADMIPNTDFSIWDFSADYWLYNLFYGWPYPTTMDDTFTFFMAWGYDAGYEGSIMTPYFTASEETPYLAFDVEELVIASGDVTASGPQLYVEVSADLGRTWETGTVDYMNLLPGHPTATSGSTFVKDLTAYEGKQIRVRFRAISDYGGSLVFVDKIKTMKEPTDMDLAISVSQSPLGDYTKVPVKHVSSIQLPEAEVSNKGIDVAAGDATITVTSTPAGFSETYDIPALAWLNSTSVAITDEFTPTAAGTYSFEYNVTLNGDVKTDNNTATTASIEVTENEFAQDNGSVVNGVGSNGGAITFGSLYTLLESDVVENFSLAFTSATATTFKLSIWKLTGASTVTEVYTSGEITKGAISEVGGTPVFVDYAITPQTLEAGTYLFAINQLVAGNIALAYDSNSAYDWYAVDEEAGAIESLAGSTFGSLLLRVKTSTANPNPTDLDKVNNDIAVYPTLTRGDVTVSTAGAATVKVSDVSGRIVETATSNGGELNLTLNCADGMYLVVVETEGKVSTYKVMLRK